VGLSQAVRPDGRNEEIRNEPFRQTALRQKKATSIQDIIIRNMPLGNAQGRYARPETSETSGHGGKRSEQNRGVAIVLASQRAGAKHRPVTASARQAKGSISQILDGFVALLFAMTKCSVQFHRLCFRPDS
jgi:hypothetical protein